MGIRKKKTKCLNNILKILFIANSYVRTATIDEQQNWKLKSFTKLYCIKLGNKGFKHFQSF